ncbi:MAG: hypothetical protein OEV40_19220, partial [Acidimicrobiia bacterium]|nr:hypothetical protein [Acidimicrobiia bacterium]
MPLAIALAVLLVSGACASGTDEGLDRVQGDVAASDTSTSEEPTSEGTDSDDQADSDTSTTEQPTTSALAGDANVDLSDAAQVAVLDAGAEPRTQLRTRITPGQSETLVMVQTQDIRQEIAGQASPGAGPIPMIIEMDLRADSMGGTLLTYTSDITSVAVGEGVDPTLAAQLEEGLQVMIGLRTMSVVDDRGRVLTTEI